MLRFSLTQFATSAQKKYKYFENQYFSTLARRHEEKWRYSLFCLCYFLPILLKVSNFSSNIQFIFVSFALSACLNINDNVYNVWDCLYPAVPKGDSYYFIMVVFARKHTFLSWSHRVAAAWLIMSWYRYCQIHFGHRGEIEYILVQNVKVSEKWNSNLY